MWRSWTSINNLQAVVALYTDLLNTAAALPTTARKIWWLNNWRKEHVPPSELFILSWDVNYSFASNIDNGWEILNS